MYMEISQGKSLCSYSKKGKMSFFLFTKSDNWRTEQVMPGGGTTGSGKEVGKMNGG
jgi:hypothetical protein